MKKQKAAAPDVDQYLNLGSEHDNEQALNLWLDALKTTTFPDAATPLKVFVELRNELLAVADQPAQVLPLFDRHTEGMDGAQKLFVAGHLARYFKQTVFGEGEGVYLTAVSRPLKALSERLEVETGQAKKDVKTRDLRGILKDIFREEMERLPEYLQSLEPKERLNILCKMMPYVLPKVEAVHATEDEPFQLL